MNKTNTADIDELPLNTGVRVLVSNEDGLVGLEKPEGLMSHPNGAEDIEKSLLTASYDYSGEFYFWKDAKGQERRVWLINRLDSPTSGVILIGLNPDIASMIKLEFSTHKVSKHYHAIVRHKPSRNAGTWDDLIAKDIVRNGRRIKKARQIKAKSTYQYIKHPIGGFPVALIKLSPVTGRTHQLRIQCSKHKHPIVGDRTYGHFGFNKEVTQRTEVKRMLLHSSELIVKYALNGVAKIFHVESKLPGAFHEVLQYRPGLDKAKKPQDKDDDEVENPLPGRRFKTV